ncbi:hypothetical protein IP92_03344 [Pseudoduganella flava]|uniref:Uncharacterized protein n=1 Tax=Pseudoduganella flava TaxID=871742 RepID=A0A562PNB4_9BURK|nr:DUF6058 family natural product biosynthesis protein [Pseudoduganella flava]QGZ40473.1 hypothetical protein GO485_16360 [Pseudoduganella flava]TWI45914.1 hypothetical protein IP92_03344 [Pseudoduganella flava]
MDLLTYLDTHLLTEAALLAAAGIDSPTLVALQSRGMVPQPAYRLALTVRCTSFFGSHAEDATRRYYAVGTPAWIAAVRTLDGESAARALFERRYLARLHALDPAATADLPAEWRGFLDGTYGLCTKSGLPEDIAAKEWAATTITRLIAQPESDPNSDHTALHAAVDLLDAASSPFAPHERARSSRHRLVDAVRARFGLAGATG